MSVTNQQRFFFVTGTDTEIGKTLVSSTLVYAMTQRGWQSVGMKPVAAGAELVDGAWCNEDVLALKAVSNLNGIVEMSHLINPYLFKLPAAPHIAAQQEEKKIDVDTIIACYQQLKCLSQAGVVEGVGGFRVPLNEDEDSADMAQRLNLPVVLVVGMRLGCISAALLTAEAIVARGLKLAGWVANSAQQEMNFLQDNLVALQQRLPAPYLGYIPHLENPVARYAVNYLDLTALFGEG